MINVLAKKENRKGNCRDFSLPRPFGGIGKPNSRQQTAKQQTADSLTVLQEFQVLPAVNILKLKLIPDGYPAYPPGIFFD